MERRAWERMTQLYTPLVTHWSQSAKLQEADVADVVQEVFQAVAKDVHQFRTGDGMPPFRGWLYGITRHKICDHFRRRETQPPGQGGSNSQAQWAELPESESSEDSEAEAITSPDSIAFRALQLIKTDFQDATWRAFWRSTIDEQKPVDVANELGLSVGAVYTAKSRVLAHLRSEFAGLL